MTIENTTNVVSYTASGTNDTFPYTYRIFDERNLEVYVNSVLQTYITDYTVTGADEPTGGNVVFETGSIPAEDDIVVIYRYVPQTQNTDWVGGDSFDPETLERTIDRVVCMVQQLQDEMNRTVKLARTVTDSGGVEIDYDATERAAKFIGFDGDGDIVLEQDLGTWQGDWTTATVYVYGDIVRDPTSKNIYRCTEDHTSGTFATDLANGLWSLMINVSDVETAKDAAEAAAALAQEWAENPEDSDVTGYPGHYSALHHAAKAEAWHDQGFSLDPSPDSDHTVSGFRATPITAGENLVYGDFCYRKNDNKMYKADADSATTMPIVAMAMETINADATGEFLFRGFARDDSWSWTPGKVLYASVTAGTLAESPPSGTGDIIQPVAVAVTTTVILLNPVYGYATHK